ncbi:hypothetical protein HJG60_009859 [Phyllostomus discolor]|uniref:Uncharacterized protein n=1 Tax=Phyllostomus discolor TaxID=89673 RepID=A0A834ELF4_9CHIR|nr:hypothetical protein HJG60_009859 [Phyllostomus discolor]
MVGPRTLTPPFWVLQAPPETGRHRQALVPNRVEDRFPWQWLTCPFLASEMSGPTSAPPPGAGAHQPESMCFAPPHPRVPTRCFHHRGTWFSPKPGPGLVSSGSVHPPPRTTWLMSLGSSQHRPPHGILLKYFANDTGMSLQMKSSKLK